MRGWPLRPRSRRRTCRPLLADAIKLYVEVCSDPYGDEALGALQVTPTEACTVATALLHAQSLSPFEFSVWFASSGR